MRTFNFYINVDECLNMSNFEMFFYKLQANDQFYVVDACLNNTGSSDMQKRDLSSALNGIRDYMGPRLMEDYRLIFGIRQKYKRSEDCEWTDTVLYKLLTIYYNLQNADIYIKSKEPVDKNVTVILLYDVKNTFDEREIRDEISDHTGDIPKLLQYLDIDWEKETDLPEEFEIESKITQIEAICNAKKDRITKEFMLDYYKWISENHLNNPSEEELEPTDSKDLKEEVEVSAYEREAALVYSRTYNLITFIDGLIGQYCVFTKSISSNAGAHRLALLSVVDYITTGLIDEDESAREYSNESLKQKAKENWVNARNNEELRKKYGVMIQRYENRLSNKLISLDGRTAAVDSSLSMQIEIPRELSSEQLDKKYVDTIASSIDEFSKSALSVTGGSDSRDYLNHELGTMIGNMKESLQKYSQELCELYRSDFQKRREDKKNKGKDDRIYELSKIEEKINEAQKIKDSLLKELEQEQMNPSIRYQDQLNADNAIRMYNDEISYYHRRRKQISALSFLLLTLIAGGLIVLQHILLQGAQITGAMRAIGAAGSIVIGLILFLFSYEAPSNFYFKKIKGTLDKMKKELLVYSHGYTEQARNFKRYINIINRIDAMNMYLNELEEMKERVRSENRGILWHKERIESHIKKCGFFQLLYFNDGLSGTSEGSDIKLDIHTGVINNPLYWPQEQFGEKKYE